MTRRTKILAGLALGIPALATGLVGFAHTAAGRPLLALMAGGGCPVPPGARRATPEQRESFRAGALAAQAGSEPAKVRPALGFDLGATTAADARTWAQRHAVSCEDHADRAAMRCERVPARALGERTAGVDDLWLSFGPDGRLVAVDAFSRNMGAAEADAALHDRARAVARATGARTATTGDDLEERKLGQRAIRFRFSNYAADLSATSLPWSTVLVRERYSSI